MRTTRTKLAVLAASAVIIALAAATAAFNLFIGWKIEADAQADIAYALGLGDDTTGRTPNFVLLDTSYAIDASERRWCTEEEAELAAWFAKNPRQNEVRRISLGDWTCYAAIVPAADYTGYYEEPFAGPYPYTDGWEELDGYYMAYLDTTSEGALVRSVNIAFAVIGAVGALVAGAAGYVAGRRIDTAQEAQKRFYENMSHDLKTPLAAIRGYAEGASAGVVDVKGASRAIVRETGRMTDTINEILGLSRLEAGAVRPHKEAVDVGDFVQDCLMPLEGAVRTKGIDVQLDLAPGEVMADPGLFDHALSNVLDNAVRHAASCVHVSYDGCCLSVWNDGPVPDKSQLPHLFDRFHAGEGGSTGIGLAIAKETASLHGWQIGARCVKGGLEVAFSF